MKSKGAKVVTVLIAVIFFLFTFYTLNSHYGEPHDPILVVSSTAYSQELATSQNGSTLTLFYHTFVLSGSKASFGFSFHNQVPTVFIHPGANPMWVDMTKVNQTVGFPPFGTFMLSVGALNVTVSFNGSTYVPNTVWQLVSSENSSVAFYSIVYNFPVNFTVINGFNASGINNMHYLKSYNLTYSLEVTPVVEFGPYYESGTTQWISHTFEYPYV